MLRRRIAARELGDDVTVLTLTRRRGAPRATPDALAACGALAGGCARLPLLLDGDEAVAGALAVAARLSDGRREWTGDGLDAAVAIKRWTHWARSVDGDVLQRLYALYVGPRRLLERGGIEYALAPLPPTERALALERCRDCNAPLDTALTAELASALATVEETLASGDLAPGFPSLAASSFFPSSNAPTRAAPRLCQGRSRRRRGWRRSLGALRCWSGGRSRRLLGRLGGFGEWSSI